MFGLSGLSGYLAIAILVLTGVGYVLFNSLVSVKAELKIASTTITAMVDAAERNKAIQKSFELSHSNILLQYQAMEANYKRDSGKEYVIVAKKELVRKLMNKKFKNQERSMACLTGNDSKC